MHNLRYIYCMNIKVGDIIKVNYGMTTELILVTDIKDGDVFLEWQNKNNMSESIPYDVLNYTLLNDRDHYALISKKG